MTDLTNYLPAGFLGFVVFQVVALWFVDWKRLAKWRLLWAALPGLLWLIIFYTFVVHVFEHFHGWPVSDEELGRSRLLQWHGYLLGWPTFLLGFLTFFVWPGALLICFCIRRWRQAVAYLGAFLVSNFIAAGLIFLAPSGFWDWFLD